MPDDFRITIASPPDRTNLVAEVFLGNEQIAELNQEEGELRIEVYARRSGARWVVPYEGFLQAVLDAKQRLVGK